MTAITSPLVTQSSTEWLDITEVQEPTRPWTGSKINKINKINYLLLKDISYGYLRSYRPILTWHSKFELIMMIGESGHFLLFENIKNFN